MSKKDGPSKFYHMEPISPESLNAIRTIISIAVDREMIEEIDAERALKILNINPHNRLTILGRRLARLVDYFDEQIPVIFKKQIDIDIAYALVELIKRRNEIENFNKKSLYILIREMTNVNTSQITRVTNIFKKHYKKLLIKYDKYGTLSDEKNKFF